MYALPHYDKGDWNCICDVCGRQFKASQLQLRWDGVMVCESDWEPRQPQDFIRGVPDYQAPKWTRPEQSDEFIPVTFINYPQ
ncbi:ubiquitin [Caudoviricetes sp.]|nr:ubiquitin [Caudoviricetes sp.]